MSKNTLVNSFMAGVMIASTALGFTPGRVDARSQRTEMVCDEDKNGLSRFDVQQAFLNALPKGVYLGEVVMTSESLQDTINFHEKYSRGSYAYLGGLHFDFNFRQHRERGGMRVVEVSGIEEVKWYGPRFEVKGEGFVVDPFRHAGEFWLEASSLGGAGVKLYREGVEVGTMSLDEEGNPGFDGSKDYPARAGLSSEKDADQLIGRIFSTGNQLGIDWKDFLVDWDEVRKPETDGKVFGRVDCDLAVVDIWAEKDHHPYELKSYYDR